MRRCSPTTCCRSWGRQVGTGGYGLGRGESSGAHACMWGRQGPEPASKCPPRQQPHCFGPPSRNAHAPHSSLGTGAGYHGLYTNKAGNSREGCALFYRTARFSLVTQVGVCGERGL